MAVPTCISKKSAVALHTFSVLVNHCYAQIILPPAILHTLNNNSPFPTPPTSVNLYSISISVNLPVLDSSYKWGINGGIIQYLPFYVWPITLKNIISVYHVVAYIKISSLSIAEYKSHFVYPSIC